jgi:hypothetical protein
MRLDRPSDYPAFRDALRFDFENKDITSKEQLSTLMRTKGYHRKGKNFSIYDDPKPKQLEFAWDYLKGLWGKPKIIQPMFYYDTRKHRRASMTLRYKNKVYRRGQFLPKEFK